MGSGRVFIVFYEIQHIIHILGKNSVSSRWVVDEYVSYSTGKPALLNDRGTAHSLHYPPA